MHNDLLELHPQLSSPSPSAVTVGGTGDTTIATIRNDNFKVLAFQFNVAIQNLDNFDVFGRSHPSGELLDFTPSNWAILPSNGRIIESSADLATVAAASNGYFAMDVTGLRDIVVKASAASDSATVTVYYSLQ